MASQRLYQDDSKLVVLTTSDDNNQRQMTDIAYTRHRADCPLSEPSLRMEI